MELKLSIKLGNAAMLTTDDLAEALNRAADQLWKYDGSDAEAGLSGNVLDVNGNTVGNWLITYQPTAEDIATRSIGKSALAGIGYEHDYKVALRTAQIALS